MNQTYLSSKKNTVLLSKPLKAIRLLLMVLFVFITPLVSFGQSQTFNTSGTFTVPPGVVSVTVQCWGAGGAGGGVTSNQDAGGAGGAGGAYASKEIIVTPGSNYAINVGQGGVGGTGNGQVGGDSWFGTTSAVIAKGGSGGTGNNGSAGIGSITGCVGTTVYKGGNGTNGFTYLGVGGGGAGSTGNGGSGMTSSPWTGGSGTSIGGGNGADGIFYDGNGNPGLGAGGGGSGAFTKNKANYIGGKGGDGQVIISYTCPTYGLTSATSASSVCVSGTSTVTLTSTTLLDGSYAVTYNTTNPNTSGNTATMVFSGTTGTLTSKILNATSTITITKISSGITPSICSSTINTNNTATAIVNTAPAITTQPSAPSATCSASGIQTISVAATGTGLTYSWQKGGVALVNGGVISGQGTATLTLTGPVAANVGSYNVVVSGTCTPAATSSAVAVTVNSAPSSPVLGTITQPTCALPTGSVVLNGLPTGSWVLTRSPGNVTTTGSGTSTTISALPAGTYAFSVNGINNGLKGEYFNNLDLSGAPVLTRTDATVVFDWINGSPDPVIGIDNFSVRWSGQVQPLYTENYTFTTRSDDGIRLWVNGTQIINNWTDHGLASDSGSIMLTAGVKYNIVLEYYEKGGQAVSKLLWNSATQPLEIIQSSRLFMASCSSPASANVIINALPVSPAIIPNKVNETCPSSNNGTIAPILSGGLTNIRYIKLTQKFNDLQQLSEIQAFEIFTGTNLALATNGAVASSKSIYNDNSAGYGSQLAIDGVLTSSPNANSTSGFYHSKGTIEEYIKVDLQSAKNIDYLKLYNRTDCCWSRGQNMLLELFDGSDNLVYSKTVNLWGGVNGPNFIEVNVLDVTWADSANTLNRTALDSGTYTLNYADALGCSVSSPVVIGSTNAAPSITVGSPIQPNCKTPTGTVTVTAPSPTTGITYTIIGTNPVAAAVTNDTGVFSGLAAGTYNVTTANGTCTSSPVSVVITPFLLVINTWNGISWSTGSSPTSDQKIVFDGDFNLLPLDSDIEGCSCTVNLGKTVNINSAKTLTLTNELNVLGTILFKDKSSLVQINDVTNTGTIEYERKIISTILPTDYTYWSSPVAGFTLGGVYPNSTSGLFYSYGVRSGVENWQQESSETVMGKGIGYIINGARPGGPPYKSPTFTGVPNNGTITFSIGFTGATVEGTSNLLGNPYPSAIDADKFLAANAAVLDGTLYFWTHNTALNLAGNIINPGPGWAYTYSLDDYASYNLTGGVGIQNAKGGVSAPSDPLYPLTSSIIDLGIKPSGKIASGQGFFATGIKAGSVTFTNDMRVAGGGVLGNNSQFFKSKDLKGKTANTIEKNRVWLNLTNTQGAFKQTLIGYVTDATNDYDNLFDGESFDANEFVDFYSVYEDKNLVIQGRALPFNATDEVPLGYRTTIDGNFTINIDEVDGSMTEQAVYIEDKLTNTVLNLKTGNYTFSTASGTFNDRFVLKYMDTSKTLSVDTMEKEDGILAFYSNNYNTLIIHNDNFDETVNSLALFNMAGQKIEAWDVSDSEQTNIQVPVKSISSGIYIVKVSTTKGESSKKIVVN